MSEMETMRAELARMKEENELMQLKAQLVCSRARRSVEMQYIAIDSSSSVGAARRERAARADYPNYG